MLKEMFSRSAMETRRHANDQAYNLVAACASGAAKRGNTARYRFWRDCRHESALVYCRICDDYVRYGLAGKLSK